MFASNERLVNCPQWLRHRPCSTSNVSPRKIGSIPQDNRSAHALIQSIFNLSLRTAGAPAITLATLRNARAAVPGPATVKTSKFCKGNDNASHVLEGITDPEPQYVMTLSGTFAFAARGGGKFTLHPGEVLVAEDNTGSGHRWNLIDDQPWRRGYVVLKPGAPDSFIPNDPTAAKVCKAP